MKEKIINFMGYFFLFVGVLIMFLMRILGGKNIGGLISLIGLVIFVLGVLFLLGGCKDEA